MNQALRLGMVVSLLCLGFGPGAANWSSNNHMVSTSYSPTFEETSDSYTTAFLNVTYTDPETGRLHTEKTEVGKFGEYHVGSAAGQLIQVVSNGEDWDTTGCTLPIRPSDGGEFPKFKWIALVKRGTCNFQVKLDNAFHYNASGVIIYNDRDSTGLDKMKLSTRHRNLSAVFTFKWKGEDLVRLLDNGTKIFASISVASHCTKVISSINRTSVLFVSVSFVVLMVMSLAWLVFYYVQRFRYIHAKDRLSRRLCSAAKKALSKIPTKHIKNEDKDSNGEIECCAVCLEAYKYSDVVRILPCRHEFHRSCIDPWLLEHRTCPMCKMDILKYYGFVFTGSQESILHMDMEETVSDSERFHSPIHTINTGPPMRTANIQTLQSGPRPISVESYHTHAHLVLQNQFSRSSTPDELTPALTRVASPGSEAGTGGSHRNMFHRVASESDFSLNRSTPSQMRRSVSLDTIDIATVSPHSPA